MKPKLLLRLAAVIILLHALGHTMGVYTWKDPSGQIPQELINQMTGHKFSFMGAAATMGGYYEGFGYASTIAMLLIMYILWSIAGIAEKNISFSVKILWPVAVTLFLLGIDEIIYFFPLAVAFSFIACLLTIISIFKLNKSTTAS